MLLENDLTQPITYIGSAALHNLGSIYFDNTTGRGYRYVKAATACANDVIPIMHSLCWDEGGEWIVNNDVAGGTGLGVCAPAGVIIAALPELYFGWIQQSGLAYCIGDESIAKTEAVVLDAASDGELDTMGDGEEEQVFGVAVEDDATTTAYVHVMLKTLI